jgi:hypothetical protein
MDQRVMDAIGQWDREYKPSDGPKVKPGLDTLPDGDYDLEIAYADLGVTSKTNDTILRIGLKVLTGPMAGVTVEKPIFFNSQVSVDILGAELVTLGFDADKWTAANGRRFSQELVRVVPLLRGICFRGHKKRNESNGEVYHNLYVNAKLPPRSGNNLATAQPLPSQTAGHALSPCGTYYQNSIPF